MLSLVMMVAGASVMYQVATAEDRSGVLWMIITLAIGFALNFVVPLPAFMNFGLGVVVAFTLMFILNVIKG